MKMTRKLAPLAIAIAAAAGAQMASADIYTKDTVILRVGASYVDPIRDQVTFADETFFFGDAYRVNVDPGTDWTWHINGVWLPMEHWGIELHYIDNADHNRVFQHHNFDGRRHRHSNFRTRMATAFVNWYFICPESWVQPYIGVGLNYTDFRKGRFNLFNHPDWDEFRDLGFYGRLDQGHSWGFAWQAGIDFVFGRDNAWLVNASAQYFDSETEKRVSIYNDQFVNNIAAPGPNLVAAYSGDYRYNPWVFNLAVGYKFSF